MSKQNVASEIIEEFKKKIATIPLNQRLSAIAVYNKLKQYTTSEDILDEKIAVISKEFEGQQWKITTKVDHIISGERKCDEDELKVVEEFLNEGETIKPEDNDGAKMVGFWLKVFENSDIHLKEQDKAILKYLKQIDISSEEKLKEPKQYKYLNLKLIFEENEHFENTELSVKVTYEYLEIPVKSEGTVINWKAGKNITTKPKTAKKGKKDRKKAKNAPSEETILSFFDIFGNFSEISDQEFDPENPEQFNQPCQSFVEATVDAVNEVAGCSSVQHYMECNVQNDCCADGDGDCCEDLEDIEEDEEDDDDEEEDDGKAKRKASGKSGKSKKSKKSKKSRKNTEDDVKIPKEPNQEECKQNQS